MRNISPIMPDKANECVPAAGIVREASATPEEFVRGLALAFPGKVTRQGSYWRVSLDDTMLEIDLAVLPPRVIASLHLPLLRVVMHFISGTPEQRASMLARMDLAMQRGGG